jgi:hypothetical protein
VALDAMRGSEPFWLHTFRVIGDNSVPLTLSRSSASQVATIGFPTIAIDALVDDRRGDVVPIVIQSEATKPLPLPVDIVEEWGLQSFPASDPPANW